MTDKLIDDIRKELDNGTISSNLLFEESISKAKKYQDEYNSFVTIMENFEKIDSNSMISGIPYALKDNISTKGILTTASSNILFSKTLNVITSPSSGFIETVYPFIVKSSASSILE